jgi:signal peptidase II
LLISACIVVIFDQVLKAIVISRLDEGQSCSLACWFGLRRITNRGGAFGLAGRPIVLVMLWCFAVGVVLWCVLDGRFFQRPITYFSLGAALGGATSNLLDRLRRGGVIDYIAAPLWPVFNLADAAIVLGISVALIFRG